MEKREAFAREISFVMPRIAHALTSSFAQSLRLPPAQIFTILALQERGSCRLSELSKQFKVAAPTVTGIVDRLEKAGFVKRSPDKKDRRAINAVLTKKGLAAADSIRASICKSWLLLLRNISLTDCENYLKLIKKIDNAVQSVDTQALIK